MVAMEAWLVNYSYKYWHFSYGDRYYSFWKHADAGSRKADYGPIEL